MEDSRVAALRRAAVVLRDLVLTLHGSRAAGILSLLGWGQAAWMQPVVVLGVKKQKASVWERRNRRSDRDGATPLGSALIASPRVVLSAAVEMF